MRDLRLTCLTFYVSRFTFPQCDFSPPLVSKIVMTCQEFPLDDFVDGLLDAESRVAVAAHLRECPACAVRVETLSETRGLLQQAKPIAASPQFEQRLDTRFRREDLKRDGWKLLSLGMAAVAALLRLLLARPRNGRMFAAPALSDGESTPTNEISRKVERVTF